jgi:hypothetical protein
MDQKEVPGQQIYYFVPIVVIRDLVMSVFYR